MFPVSDRSTYSRTEPTFDLISLTFDLIGFICDIPFDVPKTLFGYSRQF